jgi:hypothetical protein
MAGEATKQSRLSPGSPRLDCFAAARNDGWLNCSRESGENRAYFTSFSRSASFRLALVIATGVNKVICWAGFLPEVMKSTRV